MACDATRRLLLAQVLHIFCYQRGHYLTASFPTHRIGINVRRLVEAGHKVGVVRQIETAAVKVSECATCHPLTVPPSPALAAVALRC
jgi:DNA mismatch repair ATPase MutS